MSDGPLSEPTLAGLTASRLWARLPVDLRALAARALYARETEEPAARRHADAVIAQALRFREVSVRRMPVEKRAEYLVRAVRPDETLAASMLVALHVEHRRPMLARFLDSLGIAHEQGVIRDPDALSPPSADRLASAASELRERFPRDDVDLYFASLVAMDPDTWRGLSAIQGGGGRNESRPPREGPDAVSP